MSERMDGLVIQVVSNDYTNSRRQRSFDAGQDETSLPGGEQVALNSGTARGVRPIWQVGGLYAQKRYTVLHDLDYSMFHGAGKVLQANAVGALHFRDR